MENLNIAPSIDGAVVADESVELRIRTFLNDVFIFGEDPMALPGNASLIGQDVIDSMGILELVMFLEETFGIQISERETTPSNLDTVEDAVRFVHLKLAAK